MKKSTLPFLFCAAALVSSCQKEPESAMPAPAPHQVTLAAPAGILPANQLVAYLKQVQTANEATGGTIQWNTLADNVVFSALEQGNHLLTIGYRPAGAHKPFGPGASVHGGDWQAARQRLLAVVLEEERQLNPRLSESDVLVNVDELPFFSVRCRNPRTLMRLRQAPELRWVMPSDYSAEPLEAKVRVGLEDRGETALTASRDISAQTGERLGCQSYPANFNLRNGADFSYRSTGSGNALVSWNYKYHFIEDTWNSVYNGTNITGRGVRLFVIDTGVNQNQANFNSVGVVPRTLNRFATLGSDAHDLCGHGTAMAGAAGASLRPGTSMGVAYGADMTMIKAMNDVVISSDAESRAVAAAIRAIANRGDNKNAVVSMSIGGPFDNSIINDAFEYLNNSSKRDKTLIFAAAGTSTPIAAYLSPITGTNPVYPANRGDVVAVTGYKTYAEYSPADRDRDASRMNRAFTTRCESCFNFSDTDFAIVMNKDPRSYSVNGYFGATNEPLTQASSGNTPATVGGSSVATAEMAGIAALVWQRYPYMTRQQVYDRLRNTGREVYSLAIGNIPVLPNVYAATR